VSTSDGNNTQTLRQLCGARKFRSRFRVLITDTCTCSLRRIEYGCERVRIVTRTREVSRNGQRMHEIHIIYWICRETTALTIDAFHFGDGLSYTFGTSQAGLRTWKRWRCSRERLTIIAHCGQSGSDQLIDLPDAGSIPWLYISYLLP
jgi:hypothetical protein